MYIFNFCYVHFLVMVNDWAQKFITAELHLIMCQNVITKKNNEEVTLF
jgi:hypothetical protein